MKQKDFLLIGVIVLFSAIFSFVISHFIFNTPKNRQMQAEVVSPISTDFTPPDKNYFNANSIDPTQLVIIGTGANTTPFNGQ